MLKLKNTVQQNSHRTILLFDSILCLFFTCSAIAQNEPIVTHDPSTAKFENGKYFYFSTGNGIQAVQSPDLKQWKITKPIFEKDKFSSWITDLVKNFKGHFWAPDVIFMNGYFYVYYSCSSFGSAVSAIGVVRSKSLDADDANLPMTVCAAKD